MKVKRFVVPSMQVGLKQIGATLGPGAVILSNKKLASGLEIVAGVDEAELAEYQASQPAVTDPDAIIKASADRTGSPRLDPASMQHLLEALAPKTRAAFAGTDAAPAPVTPERTQAAASALSQPDIDVPKREPASVAKAWSSERQSPTDSSRERSADGADSKQWVRVMREEIDSLRQLLIQQTEHLQSPATSAMSPQRERLEARLQTLGLSAPVQRSLLRPFDSEASLDTNWRRVMGRLAAGMTAPVFDPVVQGGQIALCGPTGAGKTTTLAKLAARYVKHHGSASMAIVSTDFFQMGAQDALANIARILGVHFVGLQEGESLSDVLASLADRDLVLIDSSGSREALAHWREQVIDTGLDQRLQTTMVLPATAHADGLSQYIKNFPGRRIDGVVVTKLDEAPCFGGIFDAILRHRWPLWYTTDGQNIPADIALGDPVSLVKRLVRGLSETKSKLAYAS
ncbi:flagellar biosynthesis protein FlhF [Saccharospirillum impatiens]|uniref:flagellar biosynthesis protein FlhF n=1 Tax=Saccharospirillum impatiens TaxID=169438 RepID=UPI0004062663|nr:flagellar biosynthesis protein FlhF [Saccharospirillum impatiens]